MAPSQNNQSQRNLLNSSPRTLKPRVCVECHDELGVYTFSNRKMYCKPCSSSVQCDLCKLELYTVISHDGSGMLKTRFASDAPITEGTQNSFRQMNQFTTLYGHDELAIPVKPVFNFFQQIQQNPLQKKTKTLNVCMGCLKQHVSKTMSFMSKPRKASKVKKEASISLGTYGKLTNLDVFANILSFLPMPQPLENIMLVCQSWRAFFTHHSDLSWFNNLHFGAPKFQSDDPLYHISLRKKEEEEQQLEQAAAATGKQSTRNPTSSQQPVSTKVVWTDRALLNLLKSLHKQCKLFSGFTNLRAITFDKASSTQQISDYGFLCICAAMNGAKTLESVDLSRCPEITWMTMMSVAENSQRFTSFKICGSEQLFVFRKLMRSPEHQQSFESLQEIHISRVDKLGLSILDTLDEFRDLHTMAFTQCTLYWDEKGLWNRIKAFPKVTTLDLSDTDMPLRDSPVDLFRYFPNVEHLHCNYVQRANVADKVEMFRRCGPAFTDDISIVLEFRVAEHEEYIIKKGEIGREMYFLTKGNVQVVGDNGKVLAVLKEGVFFGEIALLFDTPRTASVRALGNCHLYVLEQAALFRVMRFHPESKEIIKEEAKRRWEELQQQQAEMGGSLKEKSDSAQKPTPPKASAAKAAAAATDSPGAPSNLPPISKEGLLDAIRTMYNTKLRTLHVRAKGLALNLEPFLKNMIMLQTLFIEVETIKRTPIIILEMPSGEGELEALTNLRLDLTESQYQISSEGWDGIGTAAPNLETLHIADRVSNPILENIIRDCHRLKILDLPDSSNAPKAILQALSNNKLTELTSDCDIKADHVIRAVSKNHPPLRLLNLQNVVFNETQLAKLLSMCRTLQYISMQTSTMSGVDPVLFRTKFPQHAHITIDVNRNVTKKRRPGLSRASSVASMGMLNRSHSKAIIARVPSNTSLNNFNSPKRNRASMHAIMQKKNSNSMVTTEADLKLVKEKLEKWQKNSGRSESEHTESTSGRSSTRSRAPHTPKKAERSPLVVKVEEAKGVEEKKGEKETARRESMQPAGSPAPKPELAVDTLTEQSKVSEKPAATEQPPAANKSDSRRNTQRKEQHSTTQADASPADEIALPAEDSSVAPPINTKSPRFGTEQKSFEEFSPQALVDDKAETTVVNDQDNAANANPPETTKHRSRRRKNRTLSAAKQRKVTKSSESVFGGVQTLSPYMRPVQLAPVVHKSAPLLADLRKKHFSEDMLPPPVLVAPGKLAPLKEEQQRANNRSLRLGGRKSPYSIM